MDSARIGKDSRFAFTKAVDAAGFYGLGRTDKRIPIDDPVLSPDPDHPGKFTTDKIDPTTGQRVMVPVLDANGKPVVINSVTQMQPVRTGLNPRGRYAVHFHRTGVDEGSDPATIADSAVVDTPGWGIVNHSSNVNVDGNVVFNAVGAAYATEAGDEIGRLFAARATQREIMIGAALEAGAGGIVPVGGEQRIAIIAAFAGFDIGETYAAAGDGAPVNRVLMLGDVYALDVFVRPRRPPPAKQCAAHQHCER